LLLLQLSAAVADAVAASLACWLKKLTAEWHLLDTHTHFKHSFVRISGLLVLPCRSPSCEYPASRRRVVMPLYGHGGAGGVRFRVGLGGRRAPRAGPKMTKLQFFRKNLMNI